MVKNQKGIAHLGIIIAVVVLASAGFAGWRVWRNNKNPGSQQSNTSTYEANEVTDVEYEPESEQESDATLPTEETNTPEEVQPEQVIDNVTPGTGTAFGTFAQKAEYTWPATQGIAYIGVTVPKEDKAMKVEWYLGEDNPVLKHTQKNRYGTLYQYNWDLTGLANGKYHWTARIYDEQGNYQLVKAKDGNTYINMYVNH